MRCEHGVWGVSIGDRWRVGSADGSHSQEMVRGEEYGPGHLDERSGAQ